MFYILLGNKLFKLMPPSAVSLLNHLPLKPPTRIFLIGDDRIRAVQLFDLPFEYALFGL